MAWKYGGSTVALIFLHSLFKLLNCYSYLVLNTPEKQKVFDILTPTEAGPLAATLAYLNPNKLIQHDLGEKDGVSGFKETLANLNGSTAHYNVIRIFQEGNYVFAHSQFDFFGPHVGFDTFRFEDGLIVEHWDNFQSLAGPNPSGHTMTDGPTQATDLDKTDQNRALIQRFLDDVLVGGNLSALPSFFNGNNLIQHNPLLRDGVKGFEQGLTALAAAGTPVTYTKGHQVFAEGNFVLLTSEGLFGNQSTAYYYLVRIENGKIAEHWDVLQAIPPQSQWQNQNGKF